MKIDKQGRSPRIANAFKLALEKIVIRAMNVVNPCVKFVAPQRMTPNLSETGQSTRHQTQPAARAAIGASRFAHDRLRGPRPFARAGDHVPIDIIMRAVQVEHRARRVGYQKTRPRRFCNRHTDLIDMPIFQAQLAKFFLAKPVQNMVGIRPACMGDRHQNRKRHRSRRKMRKGGSVLLASD